MSLNTIIRRLFIVNRNRFVTAAHFSKDASAVTTTNEIEQLATDFGASDEELAQREEEIQRKRNKSRLNRQHYNILKDKKPFDEPVHWSHETVKYQRKMYGKYGQASGVYPGICWPTREELADIKEYERVAFPYTIEQVAEAKKIERQEEEKKRWERQEQVMKRMEKLETWKQELANKIRRKEEEAMVAKQRKERLVEEVRRHFGFKVDPRDERFKEMLEKKEKEEKKFLKEEKRKAKEARFIAKLQAVPVSAHAEDSQQPEDEKSEKSK